VVGFLRQSGNFVIAKVAQLVANWWSPKWPDIAVTQAGEWVIIE
jgi:hypothetical protein